MKKELRILGMRVAVTRTRVALFVAGYIVTGLHGPFAARDKMDQVAESIYANAIASAKQRRIQIQRLRSESIAKGEDAAWVDEAMDQSFEEDGFPKHISRRGPSSSVSWCFPVLPFVLLASDGYTIGPLWGAGQVSVYVDLIFVTIRIPLIPTWVS